MLHLAHSRYVSAAALQRSLSLLQTSSPNTLFLMALDHARRQVALYGEALLGNALALARDARERINRLGPYRCYGRELVGLDDVSDIDETKLLIDVRETGYTGSELEIVLGRRYGIEVDLSDESHILCFVTLGDSEQSIGRLIQTLEAVCREHRSALQPFAPGELAATPELVLTPRQAYFAQSRSVPLESAVGEVVAEHVTPFPPDIPVIVPGERLDSELLAYLRYLRSQQRTIVGPEDGTLHRIRIVSTERHA
jgi:arginine/lysine/ornithine decarboxylase